MKKILFVMFLTFPIIINAQSWNWAKSAGSTSDDVTSSITTDPAGFIYMAGRFSSPTITFGAFTLTNSGSSFSTFLVKYDSLGIVIWARIIDGVVQPSFVSADSFGHVYLTGTFGTPTITFGTTTLTNDSLGGYGDIFLVKYDSSGNVLWAKSAGGTNTDQPWSVATDQRGNAFIVGSFCSRTMTVGSTTLTNDTTNASGDMFIIKYDSAGGVVWAKSAGGKNGDMALSVCADGFGNVYVSGNFLSNTLMIGTSTFINTGLYDMFIIKYDSLGGISWAKTAGGSGFDYGSSVTTDVSGDVYVTGRFSSMSITFGTTTVTNSSSGTDDVYLLKYNSGGAVDWARSSGGVGNDDPCQVATDIWGNVYVAGGSSTSFIFDTTTLAGGAFLLKYSASGAPKWAACNGLEAQAAGYSVATHGSGKVYVAGDFRCSTITFGATTLTNSGSGVTNDIFLVKLDDIMLDDPTFYIPLYPSNDGNAIVYPNPATTKLIVTAPNTITTISIINLTGQMVYHHEDNTKKVQIEVADFPTGIYFVKINGTEVRKFVKM